LFLCHLIDSSFSASVALRMVWHFTNLNIITIIIIVIIMMSVEQELNGASVVRV